jgi:amino acid permease
VKHLDEEDIKQRTSKYNHSLINLLKSYVGITILILPSGFKKVGIFGALVAFIICSVLSFYTTLLLIKTRNKYKYQKIANIGELAGHVFGGYISKKSVEIMLVIA